MYWLNWGDQSIYTKSIKPDQTWRFYFYTTLIPSLIDSGALFFYHHTCVPRKHTHTYIWRITSTTVTLCWFFVFYMLWAEPADIWLFPSSAVTTKLSPHCLYVFNVLSKSQQITVSKKKERYKCFIIICCALSIFLARKITVMKKPLWLKQFSSLFSKHLYNNKEAYNKKCK